MMMICEQAGRLGRLAVVQIKRCKRDNLLHFPQLSSTHQDMPARSPLAFALIAST
jgi:hypothetical protein